MKRRALRYVLPAVVAAPLLGVTWGVIGFFASDDPLTQQDSVSCTEAMRYADLNGLPAGARNAACNVRSWLDSTYTAHFTIGRADLDAWLRATYPDTRPTAQDCLVDTADACAHVDLTPPADGGAEAVDITVRYAGPHSAVVDFVSYDV